MSFARDRDLLVLEPNLFRDIGWTGQRLVDVASATLTGKTLTLPGVDLAALGVGEGNVAVVGGAALEVIARLSATTLQVSRLREDPGGAPIPPLAVSGVSAQVWTFGPQIRSAHERVLRMVGIEPDVGGRAPTGGVLGESAVVNRRAVARAEALAALHVIFAAGAAAATEDSLLWRKAESYRERFAEERRRLEVAVDLDGDGLADAVRRPTVAALVRG